MINDLMGYVVAILIILNIILSLIMDSKINRLEETIFNNNLKGGKS